MNRYTSRKFIASMAALASASWLCYNHIITGDVYSNVVIATVAAYITGNVIQKKMDTVTK